MVNFCSDNATGAAPQVLRALEAAARGTAMPYGNDDTTRRVEARLAELFECDLRAFPVATGTAANSLCLSVLCPPFGAIYCHEEAHVQVDECGAPELYTGGAKLVPLPGAHGKIAPETLERAIVGAGNQHHVQPAALSLTQATEAGTLYRPEETAALSQVARAHGLGLHIDGARFANAVAALGCSPADLTWRVGVDALSFGATKNGCLAAEAVVLFKPELAETFAYRRKRGGHLFSKMRFLSAQLEAYLSDDLWLANARTANARAKALAEGLAALPDVRLVHPVEANEIFARLPRTLVEALQAAGFAFYDWTPAGDRTGDEDAAPGDAPAPDEREIRLVTAFCTTEAEVESFLAAARRRAGGAGQGRAEAGGRAAG